MDIIKFFRHEPNARNDAKIVKLMMKQGVSGIGIFWCIVEMLYQSGGELMLSECERIAFELRTDSESIADVMQNYDLFDVTDGIVRSRNVTEQIEIILLNSKNASASAKVRWDKEKGTLCDSNATALRAQCDGNAKNKSNSKNNNKSKNKILESAQIFSFKQSLLNNGADEQLANDWLKVRKELKATNTETALKMFLSQVEKSGHGINEVLAVCVKKSWKGFEASWKIDWDAPATTKPKLPTLDEIMAEKRPDQLKRLFMIEDMEYGGKRPVNMIAIKAANGTYKLLWEVFDAD